MALIPDPVTCYSTARYFQKQVFRVFPESNLVVVDWITSGRHESGEKWDFESYKSINHIYLKDDDPIFIDSVMSSLSCIYWVFLLLHDDDDDDDLIPDSTLLVNQVLLDQTSGKSISDRMQDYQAIAMVIILG